MGTGIEQNCGPSEGSHRMIHQELLYFVMFKNGFYLGGGDDISLCAITPEKEALLPGKQGGAAAHGEYR